MTTSKEGKANRAKGMRFELKVRKDLEAKGWIVDKWTNNVEIQATGSMGEIIVAKMHPAKSFRGITRQNGFPDFMAFRSVLDKFSKYRSQFPLIQIGRENLINDMENEVKEIYEVIGVEVRMNGKLKKVEKEKCQWYLDNNIFSVIKIASKGEKGEIVYKEYSQK